MLMFFHIVNSELPKKMRKIVQRRRTRKNMEDNFVGEGNIEYEKIFDLFGEKETEKEKEETQMEKENGRAKKRKREKRTTQPLARWGKAAQICSEIRNLNKKSQVGCRGWWLKMNRWRGAEHFEEGESDIWATWVHTATALISNFHEVNLKSPCEFFQFGWILPILVILVILYQYLLWICSGTMSMSDQKASLKCWQHPMLTVFKRRPVGIYNTAQEITLSLISVGQAFNDDSIHW